MAKFHIVIPVYNNYTLTNQILWSLYRHNKANIDSVSVINDCSTDKEVESGLNWWLEHKIIPLTVSRTPSNLNFLLASNFGLKQLTDTCDPDDQILLLSNDVHIYGEFVPQVKSMLEANPKTLVGGVLYFQDTGWNKFGSKVFQYLEGWFLCTLAKNWVELDFLDERFAPSDYEDMDLSTTALEKGYELKPLNNPSLLHMGGQSIKYGDERLERTKQNQIKFGDKWLK